MIRSMLLVAVTIVAANATVAHAEPPKSVAVEDEPATALDTILQQFEAIERRLSDLKTENRGIGLVGVYWIDDAGVMRLPSGRPIGFWGIDAPRPAITEKR